MCLFKRHAEFCAVFSNPLRLQIMFLIGERERSVTELAILLGLNLPHASQHLRIMRDQGALLTRKDGRNVYYRMSNPKFLAAAGLVREGICEMIHSQDEAARQQEENPEMHLAQPVGNRS
ncbi:MAG: metalloregulator ArsR/SmtB family transcription factor [Opitutales bacterium]|jgi:ArsR family transcriptional regulator